MSDQHEHPADAPQPTEEEMRAALAAQLEQISAHQVVLESAVSLLNLAAWRVGLGPEDARVDLEEARVGIEGSRALVGVLEGAVPAEALAPLRDGLSQLQLAYARAAGTPAGEGQPAPPAGEQPGGAPGGQTGPAQSSGRLWVPGQ